MRKCDLPEFLKGVVSEAKYERWLHRKAMAHVRRDRKWGNGSAGNDNYKLAIHEAVRDSKGLDTYTREAIGLVSDKHIRQRRLQQRSKRLQETVRLAAYG